MSSLILDNEGVTRATSAFNNTDLNLVFLSTSEFVVTYLDKMRNVNLVSLQSTLAANWSERIPYGHISSCADNNSTILYTYYQVNESAMAEVAFDRDTGAWNPTHFSY